MQPKLRFMGTYSAKQASTTKRKKEYFFVFRCEIDGSIQYVLQELNDALIPTGNVNTADASILRDYFVHEPNILAMPISKPDFIPEKLKTQKKDQPPIAPKAQIPHVDPEEVREAQIRSAELAMRSSFDHAFNNLDNPTIRNQALRTIKKLAAQEEGVAPEHKHMFRDFSIDLRKKKLPEIALLFASKNVKLAPKDDHAHFNLARIYLILERYNEAINEINKAIATPDVTPEDLNLYCQLLAYAENEKWKRYPSTKPDDKS